MFFFLYEPQRVSARVKRLATTVHNNRTLAQLLSFLVVIAVVLQIKVIMVFKIIYNLIKGKLT